MKGKRGVTLIETVVAIAIIAVVSVAAISIVVNSSRVAGESETVYRADMTARNVVECYRYSGGNDTMFDSALSSIGIVRDGELYRLDELVIEIDKGKNELLVTVSYSEKELCRIRYQT